MFDNEQFSILYLFYIEQSREKSDILEIFTERLKESRKKAGFTQERVAELLEIGYSTYRHYEYGNRMPLVTDAAKMAKLFGVSLDYLAGLTEEPGIKK